MRFDKIKWQEAVLLYRAMPNIDEVGVKREWLADKLRIPEQTARAMLYALENRDLIIGNAVQYLSNPDDTELVTGDWHAPFHDITAIDSMLNYATKRHKITLITLNGDIIDLLKPSSFRKDPTKGMGILQELKMCRELLEYLRQAFPDATIRYKQGNHEERFMNSIDTKNPDYHEVIDGLLESKLGLAELGIEYVSEFFKIGSLWHLHGSETKCGWGVINICRVMMDRVNDNFITSHFHTTQEYIKKKINNEIIGGWSVGHLATDEAFDYNKLNRWNQGFAIVNYYENGEFSIENKKLMAGRIF